MSFSRSVQKALRWPTFLICLSMLYWSVSWASLLYYIPFLNFKTKKRGDLFGWALAMKEVFGIKVLKVGKDSVYTGPCMYLINHRSWGDFLIDQYLTQGRSTFLSRAMVAFVFPFFMVVLALMKAVMVFKRGKIPDKEKFNRWIDKERAASPQTGLAVYPEGHRSTMTKSLPLKRGMLHYAYSRKMTVQIIICANKESILSEKHCTARWGQTVWAGYMPAISAGDFATFDEFMDRIQADWDTLWKRVYGANVSELPELVVTNPDLETPAHILLGTSVSIVLVNIVFFLTLYYSFIAARWLFALLGPLEPFVLLALAVYVAASIYVYTRPYNSVADDARRGKLVLQEEPALKAPPADGVPQANGVIAEAAAPPAEKDKDT